MRRKKVKKMYRNRNTTITRRIPAGRRGTVYVSILAVATLVSLLGISAVTASRLRARASNTGSDVLDAQAYAQAALDLGRLTISLDPNWRTTQSKGWWANNV